MEPVKTVKVTLYPAYGIPPSHNKQERMHWYLRNELRKELGWWVYLAWKAAGSPRFRKPAVTYRFYFPDRRGRDPDNLIASMKGYLDGLKHYAFWDDNHKNIDLRKPEILVDKQFPRVEIDLEETDIREDDQHATPDQG